MSAHLSLKLHILFAALHNLSECPIGRDPLFPEGLEWPVWLVSSQDRSDVGSEAAVAFPTAHRCRLRIRLAPICELKTFRKS